MAVQYEVVNEAVKKLKTSGLSDDQAVAIVNSLGKLFPQDLVTTKDLELSELRLEKQLQVAVERIERNTLKWVFIAGLAFTGIGLAVLQAWPP